MKKMKQLAKLLIHAIWPALINVWFTLSVARHDDEIPFIILSCIFSFAFFIGFIMYVIVILKEKEED